MFDSSTFCILPWSSIQINPSGDFKVCCFSGVSDGSTRGNDHGMCLDANGEVMNVMTHTIMDALNSNYHKEVRLAQSKNERHPMCKVCWDRDDANAKKNQVTTSLRYFRSFRQLPDLDNAIPLEKAQSVMKDDGSIDQYPISLDLRFTNVCNMKCIMCNARYSNQWYEDEMALFNTNEIKLDSKTYQIRQENGVYKTDMPVWHDSDNWWEQFETIKHRVRHLYLTGGEPFIVKGHDVLLDKLIESGDAKNVILEYDTNLTVINDKILNRLQHFKQIILSISCDDIEERFELIRFPGKFNVMLQNLEKLKARNLQIRHLSSCVGIYSLYSPIKLYDYFTPLGYDTYSFRMLRAPGHSDVANLPDSLKLKMIDVYNNSTLPDRWKNFLCGYLENTLGKYTEEEGRMNVKKHIQFLDKMDELRGTDWKKTLPEIADLLKECL
jgi:pyruvate-formate lyase-activating enzyme